MATRPKFAKMANYSCKCVEASHIFAQYWPNSPEQMYRVRAKQGGEFGEVSEFLSQVVLYTKKDIFMYKTIQSTLAKFAKFAKFAGASHKNLLNTRQIRRSKSQKFGEFLASTCTRQIRSRVAIAQVKLKTTLSIVRPLDSKQILKEIKPKQNRKSQS